MHSGISSTFKLSPLFVTEGYPRRHASKIRRFPVGKNPGRLTAKKAFKRRCWQGAEHVFVNKARQQQRNNPRPRENIRPTSTLFRYCAIGITITIGCLAALPA